MSTWWGRGTRRRASRSADEGFTLLEVIVSLVVIGLVSAALIPVMIVGAKASNFARLNTVAKNLAQQRIESMRNLPFYVAYQNTGPNGQFYDVLDDYYANVSSATTVTFPNGGKGTWVQSGTGTNGAPAGPYYKVSFSSLPGTPGFSQVVYTQFLTAAQPVPAPVPASRLLVNSGAPLAAPNYNSAAAGQDSPPSLLLGVTVVTSWSWASQVRTDRTYTEIADNGATNTLISSQAHATALSVTTSDANGNQLIGLVGDIELNGSLANTSSASAEAVAASISQSNGASVTGANSTVVSPPNPAGSSATTGAGQPPYLGSYSPCGWGLVGPSQVSDVSTSTAGGLPIAPSDVGTGSTPASMVEADLKANGGGSCAGFRFSNSVLGTETTDPRLQLQAGYPMIQVVDSSGSSTEVAAKGAISSSSAAGNAGSVYAQTEVDFATAVQVFPGLPFVTTASTCGSGTQPCGQGLVNVFLTKATLGCQSNGSPVATASYSGYLTYWTQTGWHSLALSWSSTSGSATDPLASVNLSQTVTTYNGSPVPLSAYINAWSTGRSITQSSSGESTIPSVVAITTANTRYDDASSSIGLQLGKLSCLAVDNR